MMVSIIVPVYNERRFLNECVKSIQNQTYKDIEILLVDDGSTNGAEKDCDRLALEDNRIRVIHKENQGLSAARITGYQYVRGDWLMFVDDDDIISPYMIEEMVEYTNYDKVDIIAGRRIDSEHTNYKWEKKIEDSGKVELGKEVCKRIGEDKQETIITPLWGKLYRKAFLDSVDLEKYRDKCPTIFLKMF